VVVIDALREARPPFSPEQVVGEFAELLRTYRLQQIIADRYAGAWVTEQFAKFGVSCAQAAKPKSDLYGDLLPLINSRRIELLDHARCLSQLIALELRSVRGGRDSIDHPPHGHDDLINAAAGCASLLITSANYNIDAMCDGADDPTPVAVYRKGRLRCPPTMTPEQFERISQPIGLPFHWEQRHD
jgi:hypothetical protein